MRSSWFHTLNANRVTRLLSKMACMSSKSKSAMGANLRFVACGGFAVIWRFGIRENCHIFSGFGLRSGEGKIGGDVWGACPIKERRWKSVVAEVRHVAKRRRPRKVVSKPCLGVG